VSLTSAHPKKLVYCLTPKLTVVFIRKVTMIYRLLKYVQTRTVSHITPSRITNYLP